MNAALWATGCAEMDCMALIAEPAFPAKPEIVLNRMEKMAKRIMVRFLSDPSRDSSGFFQ
jgi:hypothetical protein